MNRKIFKWEDLSVLGENKERGHAIAFSYDNKEDACKKKEVKTKYSLNGEWKFYYQMGTDLPENFAEKELNDTNWNILKERNFSSFWSRKSGARSLCQWQICWILTGIHDSA